MPSHHGICHPAALLATYAQHRLTQLGHAPATIAREATTLVAFWRDQQIVPAEATPASRYDFCHRPPRPSLGRGNAHDLTTLEPSSADAYRRRIRAFYRWWAGPDCPAELRLAVDPLAGDRAPSPPPGPPRHMTPTQIRRIIDHATACGDARDVAIVWGLYECALRLDELRTLDASQVDLDTGEPEPVLRVRGKGVGGGKVREIPLLGEVAAAWRVLLTDPVTGRRRTSGPIIPNYRHPGRPLSAGRLWAIVKRLGDDAGVPAANPHRYRHSAATHLLDAGAELRDVAELLGHSRLDTASIYVAGARSRLRAAMRYGLVVCTASAKDGGHRVTARPPSPPPTVPLLKPRREPGIRCGGKTSRKPSRRSR